MPVLPPRTASLARPWSVLRLLPSALLALVLASGCASTGGVSNAAAALKPNRHYITEPDPPPALDLAAESEDLCLTLETIIVPEGPGSWYEGARWEEYLVRVENSSEETVRLAGFALVDHRGVLVEPDFDLERLEARTKELAAEYEKAGIAALAGAIADPVKMAASVAVPLAVGIAPVAVVGGAGYFLYRDIVGRKDRRLVNDEFRSRLLPAGLSLAGGGEAAGSVFFPVTAAPRKLILTYWAGGKQGELAVELPRSAEPATSAN